MRIDKLLWFLRFAKTRSLAQTLVNEGHIRINSRRIDRPAARIFPGDVITLPLGESALIIELLALPERRGPHAEAHSCYRVLDEVRENPIAAGIE